jgi:hypothetical protein
MSESKQNSNNDTRIDILKGFNNSLFATKFIIPGRDMHLPNISYDKDDKIVNNIITWNIGSTSSTRIIYHLLVLLLKCYIERKRSIPILLLQEISNKTLCKLEKFSVSYGYQLFSCNTNINDNNLVILIPIDSYIIQDETFTKHMIDNINEQTRMISINIQNIYTEQVYSIFNLHIQNNPGYCNYYEYILYALNYYKYSHCIIGGDFNRPIFKKDYNSSDILKFGELINDFESNCVSLTHTYFPFNFFNHTIVDDNDRNNPISNPTYDHIFYSKSFFKYLFDYRVIFNHMILNCAKTHEFHYLFKEIYEITDFNNLWKEIRKEIKTRRWYQYIDSINLISIPIDILQTGGYKKKYLKYKKLYLELKLKL